MNLKRNAGLCVAALAMAASASAQVTLKPDGQWRHLFGAGASFASGNSDATSVNLNADSVRATEIDKWTFVGRGIYAKSEGETTGERVALGTQYNRDFADRWFGFGSADALRDRPANLSSRWSTAGGAGYHVVRSESSFWDVSAGLGYTKDRYLVPTEVDGETRSRYGRAELVLAEESRTQLTDTTAFQQKLSVLGNLRNSGDYRAVFDSSLSVAINSTLSLTAGLSYRYNSDPGEGFKNGDALFVTGIAYRLD